MSKYHIDKNGKPAICKAVKKPCIYASIGGQHFNSIEDAQLHADKLNEISQRLTKEISISDFDNSKKQRESFLNKILNKSNSKNRGWDAEVFLSSEYAKSMGLTDALVLNENGTYSPVTWKKERTGERFTKEELQEKIRLGRAITKEAYDSQFDFKNKKSNPVRVIYFAKDSNKMFVQTGAPDTLDGIKAEEGSIKVLEMKKTVGNGAQMSQKFVAANTDGGFEIEDANLNPEVERVIHEANIYDNEGGEIRLKLPPQEAMKQFVKDYKAHGASELIYMNAKRRSVSISLNDTDENIANELMKQGLTARLKIRTNQTIGAMNQESLTRFVINKSNLYDGEINEENATIKYSQLNKSKMVESRGRVKVGEFLTKIKWKDRNSIDPNTEINIMDLDRFVPVLSGDIKLLSSARK